MSQEVDGVPYARLDLEREFAGSTSNKSSKKSFLEVIQNGYTTKRVTVWSLTDFAGNTKSPLNIMVSNIIPSKPII
jgi:hypothetical protein